MLRLLIALLVLSNVLVALALWGAAVPMVAGVIEVAPWAALIAWHAHLAALGVVALKFS